MGQILKDLQLPLNGKSRKEQMNVDGLSVQIDGNRIMEDVNDSLKIPLFMLTPSMQ